MPDPIAFALNQRTASGLDFAAFLDLAARLGCVGVEARTDLGRPAFDGIAPAEAGRMAAARGLRLLGLSEIHPFDDWTPARRDETARLIDLAAAAGAETISLVPRVDGGGPRGAEGAARRADILAQVLTLCAGTGVMPLVEPIGFPGCSIRRLGDGARAIDDLGAAGRIGLVHDTFQHALAQGRDGAGGAGPGAANLGGAAVHVRICHISGMPSGAGPLRRDDDARRVLPSGGDRTGAAAQMRALRAMGWRGPFSVETTDPRLAAAPDLEARLAASFKWVRAQLARA